MNRTILEQQFNEPPTYKPPALLDNVYLYDNNYDVNLVDFNQINQTISGVATYTAINNGAVPLMEEAEQPIPMSLWIKITFYIVYVLICLLGIFGNAIVCYIVARKTSMHTVTNVFIANLALSDILLCLFAVPFTPLYLITFKSWIFGRVLCHLVPFAQGVSVYISAFTLMSIAIDRYFVILHPFKPRMLMHVCIIIIAAIWILAVFLTFPYAHFMELIEEMDEYGRPLNISYCNEQWPHDELSKMFGITTTALQFVIPFMIITFCYVRISAKLSDRARTIPGNVSARREEQERERTRKTNGMLISMVVIFLISWLPLNMFNLLMDFYEEASQWRYGRTIFIISHAIAMSSTCYNPFLYAWLNENFRKEFKEVLPCFALITRKKSPLVQSSILRTTINNNEDNTSGNPNPNPHENSNIINNNNNITGHDHNNNDNLSAIILNKMENISATGTGNENNKLVKLNSKDGIACRLSINNNATITAATTTSAIATAISTGNAKPALDHCSIFISEDEEARQSLIEKNQLIVRYNGIHSRTDSTNIVVMSRPEPMAGQMIKIMGPKAHNSSCSSDTPLIIH